MSIVAVKVPVLEPAASNISDSTPFVEAQGVAARLLALGSDSVAASLLALLLIMGLCGVSLALGLPHTTIYGHDLFILLDGAWRVMQGQRPHVDFYSAFGPVSLWLTAAGLSLKAGRIDGLVLSTSLPGVVLGLWGWAVIRTRLPLVLGLTSILFLTLFWLAPFPLGESFEFPSYAMQYNRLGYVLLFILMFEIFIPPVSTRRLEVSSMSSGVILGLLLFMKVSYFFVAVGLLVGACLLVRKTVTQLMAMLAGFVAVCLGMLSYFGWQYSPMLADLTLAGQARRSTLTANHEPFRSLVRNLSEMGTLAAMALLAILLPLQKRVTGRLIPITVALFAGFVIGADLLVSLSNTQKAGFPLCLAGVLVIAAWVHRSYLLEHISAQRVHRTAVFAMLLLAIIAVLPTVSDTPKGWMRQVGLGRRGVDAQGQPFVKLDAAHASTMILETYADHTFPAEYDGRVYTNLVNEGMALLRERSTQEERLTCLCFSNPFSYLLLRPPSTGGSTFLKLGMNFTGQVAPSAERMVGNASVVIHKRLENSIVDEARQIGQLLSLASPVLRRDFHFEAQSEHWVLLRRNATGDN